MPQNISAYLITYDGGRDIIAAESEDVAIAYWADEVIDLTDQEKADMDGEAIQCEKVADDYEICDEDDQEVKASVRSLIDTARFVPCLLASSEY